MITLLSNQLYFVTLSEQNILSEFQMVEILIEKMS
jgi:hypothetical protein